MGLVLRNTYTYIFLKHSSLLRLLVFSLTVHAVAGGAVLRLLPLPDAAFIHFSLLVQLIQMTAHILHWLP